MPDQLQVTEQRFDIGSTYLLHTTQFLNTQQATNNLHTRIRDKEKEIKLFSCGENLLYFENPFFQIRVYKVFSQPHRNGLCPFTLPGFFIYSRLLLLVIERKNGQTKLPNVDQEEKKKKRANKFTQCLIVFKAFILTRGRMQDSL